MVELARPGGAGGDAAGEPAGWASAAGVVAERRSEMAAAGSPPECPRAPLAWSREKPISISCLSSAPAAGAASDASASDAPDGPTSITGAGAGGARCHTRKIGRLG